MCFLLINIKDLNPPLSYMHLNGRTGGGGGVTELGTVLGLRDVVWWFGGPWV
jgi:hypothetical protein